MIDLRVRRTANRLTEPVGRGLARLGLNAGMVTVAGLVVTVAGAVVIAAGHALTGAVLVAVGSLIDALDGPVARARDEASVRGAFLDAVADRLGEIAIFTAAAYYARDDARTMTLAVVALGFSLLTPYLRARAEGYGVAGRGGLMGRAERIIVFAIGMFLEGLGVTALEPMLWIMVALTGLTVAQRFVATWNRLGA